MELFDALEKYHKIVKEEDKYNYKYNPILNHCKNTKRRLSRLLYNNIKIRKIKEFVLKEKEKEKINKIETNVNDKKRKEKSMSNLTNSFYKRGSVLEEKFFLSQIKKRKSLFQGNIKNIKGYITKSQCPCCQKELSKNETETENDTTKLENLILNPDKNFLEIKSYFITNTNNFPLLQPKIHTKFFSYKKYYFEENKDKMNFNINTYNKKADMESYLSKIKKINKMKLVKRGEINTNNLYYIEKPLITSIRGKIYKNMRQRYKRPFRLIMFNSKNNSSINNSNNN